MPTAPDQPTTPSRRKIARYYRGARTTHLERLAHFVPGDFMYYKPMYDFDLRLAAAVPNVRRVSFWRVLLSVLRREYAVLELAEPLTPSALPQNIALSVASRMSSFGRAPRTKFVAYAIENADIAGKVATRLRIPASLGRVVLRALVGFCYVRFDRIVFGTQAAEDNYRALLGARRLVAPPTHTLIWGLPASTLPPVEKQRAPQLVFLGAFDNRKGVTQLMDAWDDIQHSVPNATLLMMGKGPLTQTVLEWSAGRSNVTVLVDPDRDVIATQLTESSTLFLLSQPSALWKEQIGLPIVEGLQSGLEIVASNETGIAHWLAENGHAVINPLADRVTIARTVSSVLLRARSPQLITASLPAEDGRLAADRWLFADFD